MPVGQLLAANQSPASVGDAAEVHAEPDGIDPGSPEADPEAEVGDAMGREFDLTGPVSSSAAIAVLMQSVRRSRLVRSTPTVHAVEEAAAPVTSPLEPEGLRHAPEGATPLGSTRRVRDVGQGALISREEDVLAYDQFQSSLALLMRRWPLVGEAAVTLLSTLTDGLTAQGANREGGEAGIVAALQGCNAEVARELDKPGLSRWLPRGVDMEQAANSTLGGLDPMPFRSEPLGGAAPWAASAIGGYKRRGIRTGSLATNREESPKERICMHNGVAAGDVEKFMAPWHGRAISARMH